MFLTLLVWLLTASLLAASLVMIAAGYRMIRWADPDDQVITWGVKILGATLAVAGAACLLFFLAVVAGGVQISGHPDGCYYLHTQLVGKVLIQSYAPIACP